MLLPSIHGTIKRRVLVNFHADPEVVARQLPDGLRPKLEGDHAIVGICLIRLEQIRPSLLPRSVGFAGENAAHRIAVVWRDPDGEDREGVYIPIRHTDSRIVLLLGGRLFPGVHKRATFAITDTGAEVGISIQSRARDLHVSLRGRAARDLPSSSVFRSLAAASEFFRGGSVGYSPGRHRGRLEGLKLITPTWRVEPLAVSEVHSSWLEDQARFPAGSVDFDCALVMRDVAHRWAAAPPLYADSSITDVGQVRAGATS
jgi:hypothetical protein